MDGLDPDVPGSEPTGAEPTRARSAYRLRIALSAFGAVVAAATAVWAWLSAEGYPALRTVAVVSAVVGVVAVVNVVGVSRIRSSRHRGRHRAT